MRANFVTMIGLGALVASPVAGQERYFNFAVRAGAEVAPSYPGSGDYETQPDLGLTFGALRWGRLKAGEGVDAEPANGLSLRSSFRVLDDRTAAEHPELTGLTDVAASLEVGFGLLYQQTNWLAYGQVRKGVTGHNAFVGDLGADVILRPSDRLTLTAGPRVSLGDSDFAGTYFGVSAAEAGRSGFDAFDASGGVLGAGFAVGAQYELSDQWSLDGLVSYEKLVGDAGDSPITAAGDDDQWTLRIGISREFTLRF